MPAPDKAKEIQPFMTGLVAPLFALAGVILVFENLRNQTNQQITNFFFGLLTQHAKIVDSTSDEIDGISTFERQSSRRDFFDDLAFRIYIDYGAEDIRWQSGEDINTYIALKDDSFDYKVGLARLQEIYLHYFQIYHATLGHYFRNLYHIVVYIDKSKLSKSDKIEYLKILRAQLSNYEILLLAYNGMSVYGKKFKPLIEKYKLLKNLNFEKKLSKSYHRRIVNVSIWIDEYPHLKEEFKE